MRNAYPRLATDESRPCTVGARLPRTTTRNSASRGSSAALARLRTRLVEPFHELSPRRRVGELDGRPAVAAARADVEQHRARARDAAFAERGGPHLRRSAAHARSDGA